MPIVDSFLQELDQEAATTRRVLERVPSDKLDWRPHPKSMSLGQLAQHVATTPGQIAAMVSGDPWDMPDEFPAQSAAASTEELLKSFEADFAQAKEALGKWDEDFFAPVIELAKRTIVGVLNELTQAGGTKQ